MFTITTTSSTRESRVEVRLGRRAESGGICCGACGPIDFRRSAAELGAPSETWCHVDTTQSRQVKRTQLKDECERLARRHCGSTGCSGVVFASRDTTSCDATRLGESRTPGDTADTGDKRRVYWAREHVSRVRGSKRRMASDLAQCLSAREPRVEASCETGVAAALATGPAARACKWQFCAPLFVWRRPLGAQETRPGVAASLSGLSRSAARELAPSECLGGPLA